MMIFRTSSSDADENTVNGLPSNLTSTPTISQFSERMVSIFTRRIHQICWTVPDHFDAMVKRDGLFMAVLVFGVQYLCIGVSSCFLFNRGLIVFL
jgi:hypothetical protein